MIKNPVTPDRLKAVALKFSHSGPGPWSGTLYIRRTETLFWRCEHKHETAQLALACAKVELERRAEHLGRAPSLPRVSLADRMPVLGFPDRPARPPTPDDPADLDPGAFPVDTPAGQEA